MEITGNMQMSGPIHRIWKITSIPSDRFENKIINCLIFVKVYIKSLLNLFERKKVLVSDKLMIIKNKQTWCLGLPTIDGNTALGASSPAKPALHIPDPLSITKAATSSSHILILFKGLFLHRNKYYFCLRVLMLDWSFTAKPLFYIQRSIVPLSHSLRMCEYFIAIYGHMFANSARSSWKKGDRVLYKEITWYVIQVS